MSVWEIALVGRRGSGRVTLVDEEDAHYLDHWVWPMDNHGYAMRTQRINGRSVHFYMARVIMERKLGRSLGPGEEVDHKNRNKLDNRRENLRLADDSQQAQNRTDYEGTSGYRGVSLFARSHKWRSQGRKDGRQLHLGYYDTEEEAARAYDAWAREHLDPEFRLLNFPD